MNPINPFYLVNECPKCGGDLFLAKDNNKYINYSKTLDLIDSNIDVDYHGLEINHFICRKCKSTFDIDWTNDKFPVVCNSSKIENFINSFIEK